MKKYFLLVYLLLALGVGRVAAQKPNFGFDRDADFSKYKTYRWVSIESAQYLDELTAGQLIGTLNVALAKKGLTKSPAEKPDLYIGYQMASGTLKQLNHLDIGTEYHPPAEASSEAPEDAPPSVHSGPLAVYMFDSSNHRLVWWGVLPDAINANADPEKKQKHMDKAIEKLLRDYPPPKKP